MVWLLAACGGGGDNKGSDGSDAVGPGSTAGGVAFKGMFSAGMVRAFVITAAGAKGAQLGSGSVNSNGSYSLNLGAHTGPALLELTGGTYRDEVAGTTAQTQPLRAVIAASTTGVTANITPLTTIAAELALADIAGGAPVAGAIQSANLRITNWFGAGPILATVPADLSLGPATAGLAADQGALCAGLAQMAAGLGVATDSLVEALARDVRDGDFDGDDGTGPVMIAGGGALSANAARSELATAIGAFLASTANLSTLTAGDFSSLTARLNANVPHTLFCMSLSIQPGALTIAQQMRVQYRASGNFSDGSNQDVTTQVAWSLSNPAVANISTSGVLDASSTAGTTDVEAALDVATAAVSLTVGNYTLVSIALTPAAPSLHLGQNQQFTATATHSDASQANITALVNWQSSNTSRLTITATGFATAQAQSGTVTVTATEPGTTVAGNTTVTVFVSYAANIQPIFNQHCTNCHSGPFPDFNLRLDSYANTMAGGQSGAVVVAGSPDNSILIQRMEGTITPSMPYQQAQLPQATINRIRDWISQGANNN
jgi:hypothetical protein